MDGFRRYAVYFPPPRDSALAAFGNAWLGYDPETGEDLNRPDCAGITEAQIRRTTEAPSRYGFHATLKPPFRLHHPYEVDDLDRGLTTLSRVLRGCEIERLEMRAIGDFVALVPAAPVPGLERLAESCVADLDAFRADSDDVELGRRRRAHLSPRQHRLLRQWGYPYVFDEFRFHLTLTGRLEEPQRTRLQRIVAGHAEALLTEPVPVREIALFGDPGLGRRFRLLKRYPLTA